MVVTHIPNKLSFENFCPFKRAGRTRRSQVLEIHVPPPPPFFFLNFIMETTRGSEKCFYDLTVKKNQKLFTLL